MTRANTIPTTRGIAPKRLLAAACSPKVRGRRVTILLVATMLLAIADLYLTLSYATTVGMIELNPVARLVMEHQSAGAVTVWKLATTSLGLGILYCFRSRRNAEIGAWVCFLALGALACYWAFFTEQSLRQPAEYTAAGADDPRWISLPGE